MTDTRRRRVESSAKSAILKSEIDYAIWQAVLGRPSPWLLDREAKGKFKDRFNDDKQILLWELFKCWLESRKISQWAGQELYVILFDMAKGGLLKKKDEPATWNEAFGKPYADDKRAGGMKTRSRMFEVYQEVRKTVAEKKKNKEKIDYDEMFHSVGQRFGMSGGTAKKLTRGC